MLDGSGTAVKYVAVKAASFTKRLQRLILFCDGGPVHDPWLGTKCTVSLTESPPVRNVAVPGTAEGGLLLML